MNRPNPFIIYIIIFNLFSVIPHILGNKEYTLINVFQIRNIFWYENKIYIAKNVLLIKILFTLLVFQLCLKGWGF